MFYKVTVISNFFFCFFNRAKLFQDFLSFLAEDRCLEPLPSSYWQKTFPFYQQCTVCRYKKYVSSFLACWQNSNKNWKWKKKLSVVRLLYPKICQGNNFYVVAQMACKFAWICKYLKLPVAQTFQVMQSEIC